MIAREEIEAMPSYFKFVVKDACGKDHRCMKEPSGDVFVYAPRQKRRGYRYSADGFIKLGYTMKVKRQTDENKAWHRRIERAKKALSSSGLWPEHLVWLSNLEKMTWEDKELMNKAYWLLPTFWQKEENSDELLKLYFGDFIEKYPFIFEGGNVNTWYLWEQSDVKLKSMYFGKYEDSFYKDRIAEALREKRSYSTGRIQVSYDNSFEYNAEKNKAWYSEEYRDCGNGYYYLALDGTTALFCEKD